MKGLKWLLLTTGIVGWSLSAPVGVAFAQGEPVPPQYPILALERLSVAGQIGVEYLGLSNGVSGIAPIGVVRFVPAYAVFGKPGKSAGSVSITAPFTLALDEGNQKDWGVFLSVVLCDGAD